MKTTGIFCLFVVIFSYHAGLGYAESKVKNLPLNGAEIQPLAIEEIPAQIALMQQNIESMSSLLMQMSSVLQEQDLTAEQQKKCGAYIGKIATTLMSCTNNVSSASVRKQQVESDQLEKKWNYFETQDFLSH